MQFYTSQQLKESLKTSKRLGIVLDIDETLAATNVAWFHRCVELFGNPDNLSIPELISKYHLAQNNPAWQTKEAQEWMHQQRTSPEAQDNLPLIPNAVQGVAKLSKLVSVVGYLTVRPESVNANTKKWLLQNNFPEVPIIAKPLDVAFEDGNQWKGNILNELWPEVTAIVDDNPKVAKFVGLDYPGKVFLFGRSSTEPDHHWAIPCETWDIVVSSFKETYDMN